jgi:hypothetical protein
MNRNFKRLIALCLAAMLTLSGLVNTACGSGSTPTTPTTAEPGLEPIATDVIRIISVDAESIEVEGVDPTMGGTYRLRIEGIQSDRPIYYINGVLAGEVFGNSAGPTGPRNGQDLGREALDPVLRSLSLYSVSRCCGRGLMPLTAGL